MVRVFSKSAKQPKEMPLTICSSVSCYLFSVDGRLALGNRVNGKEISDVPFRTEKGEYFCRKSTISEWIFREITVPFDFQPNFPGFLSAKW